MPKSNFKKHNFKHLEAIQEKKSILSEDVNRGQGSSGTGEAEPASFFKRRIMEDLNRSLVLMLLVTALIALIGFAVYKTQWLVFILEKFSLSY